MLLTLVLIAVAWALLGLLGALVLVPLARETRLALLPAAPVVGASLLVVVLHTTGLFFSVRVGLIGVAVVVAVLVVIGVRRGQHRQLLDRASAAWTAMGFAAGVPLTLAVLAPTIEVGNSRVVSANQSNDGVWYVSVSSWLERHSILSVPDIGAGPAPGGGLPSDGPAVSALTFPLRVGQELVQASLNVVTGTSPITTFTPWTATWVFLLPGACIAAAALLGQRRLVGLLAGVVLASCTLVVQQHQTQNAASLLAIAMVVVVLTAANASVDRPGGAPHVPILMAAMLVSALIGTYTEYAPFVGPALVAVVVLRRRGFRTAAIRAAAVLGAAVVMAPLAWVRAYESLTGVRGGSSMETLPGLLLDAPPGVILSRLVGTGPLSAGLEPSRLAPVLAATVLVGVGLALALGPARRLWWGFTVTAALFVGYLSYSHLAYTQRRAIEIVVPVVLVAAVVGWAAAVGRVLALLDRRAGRRTGAPGHDVRTQVRLGAVVLVVLAVVPVAVWTVVNVRSSLAAFLSPVDLQARNVDSDFSDAVGWVEQVGGPGGSDVAVAVPSFFEQQWLALSLQESPDVDYPTLRSDYFRTQSFWDGNVDRYWLVGRGVQVDADPASVVYANDRFQLLDLGRGDVGLAVPYMLDTWNTGVRPDGGFTTLGDAQVLIVRSPSAGTQVEVSIRAESAVPLDVVVESPGNPDLDLPDLTPQVVPVEVDFPRGTQTSVVDLTAQVPAGSDALNWVELAGVELRP